MSFVSASGVWNRMSFETLAAGQQLAGELNTTASAAVLGQGIEALAAEQPNNVEYRRLIAYTQIYVAQALLAQDDRAAAMASSSRS